MREQAAKIRQQEADNHPDAAEKLAEYCRLLLDGFGRGVYAPICQSEAKFLHCH